MSSPLGILLSLPAGRRGLVLSVTSAAARAVGIVFIAEALVRTILDLGSLPLWIVLGLLGAGLRGASLWADHSLGTGLAAEAKRGLRARILSTLLGRRGMPRAKAAVTVTRGVDDLDDYFTTVVPALTQAAVVPAVLLVRILFADLLSAVIIIACLPLVPLFMVLIGRYTEETTAESTRALERMSDHLAELAEGLPVLIGLGRSREHARTLRRLSTDYHQANLATLRIAFLSSLALELIATISVALVAVVIGVRLVYGTMDLSDGLLALLLAPECFMPLRALGAGFHASENGRESYDRAQALLAAGDDEEAGPASAAAHADHAVTYADGTTVAWDGSIPTTPGITAVLGPSGAGKSTILAALSGSLAAGATTTLAPARAALVPQTPRTFGATLGEELATFGLTGGAAEAALLTAGLPPTLDLPTGALSPGQLRRLALVRVRGRDTDLLILDEPTAHLDDDNAELIIAMLAEAAAATRIVLASHDPRVLALATDTITPRVTAAPVSASTAPVEEGTADTATDDSHDTAGTTTAGTTATVAAPNLAPASAGAAVSAGAPTVGDRSGDTAVVSPERGSGDVPAPGSLRRRAATLRTALPLMRWTMLIALLTACASSLAAISLTALSGWLIVEASYGPPIMTLLVAIVGVRFFGLSRSIFLYVSRLNLHSAIFSAL
ncbi:ABC transporter transmembrane domain-containing protein, partial [Brevibacterium sp. NPDC056947]